MRALATAAVLFATAWPAALRAADRPARPAVFVECTVREVLPSREGGQIVMLAPKGEDVLVPIYIGDTEANAIRMRLERKVAPRPLTHDLLESMIRSLGGKVTKIEIDDLKDNVFLGKIHLVQNGKKLEIDARPSDSIALALGTGAPIFAARGVIEQTGVRSRELERPRRRTPRKLGEPPPAADKGDISL